ncbi:serine protease [Candidatus Parcubacteria bacterium]|nr:MAG: serine protease [Candidatus Parcubacteria bacterium]
MQYIRTIFTYAAAVTLLLTIGVIAADTYTTLIEPAPSVSSNPKIETPARFVATTSDASSMTASAVKAADLETVPLHSEMSTSSNNSTQKSPRQTAKPRIHNSSESGLDAVDARVRSALVNIQCFAGTRGVRSITASGVLIDSRGIILTNAHVAQHVLLSQSPEINLDCYAYYGSPAHPLWNLEVLYVSPTWIKKHAGDIKKERSIGTGEFDYALLRVTNSTAGIPQSMILPFLRFDTRSIPALPEDTVFVASYPAEFVEKEEDLNALISITSIQELLTFGDGAADVISVGGVAGAQSGSSGGALVDLSGRLLGIITTTSDSPTVSERDLRAISVHYVNKTLQRESGLDLQTILHADLPTLAESFATNIAPALIDLLVDAVKK